MLAFYVWTDTSLINSIKIKETYYKNEMADLFILDLPRVSRLLVDSVKELGIFEDIYWLQDPQDFIKKPLRRFSRILGGRYYYKHIAHQLETLKDKKYDLLFTGGLWANTLFLYKLFLKNNSGLQIAIVEEGTVSYGGTSTVFWCDADSRRRDLMFRYTLYIDIYRKACKAISSVYLSCPEGSIECGNIEKIPILACDEVMSRISSKFADEEYFNVYQKRQVVIFTQPESEEDICTTKEIIETFREAYGSKDIIVRIHPNQKIDSKDLVENPDIYVDYGVVPFELMLSRVSWEEKTLIARASSCMFYPFYLKREEPRLYFIFHLYAEKNNQLISNLSERLTTLYTNTDRIQIPRTTEELKNAIPKMH